MLCSYTVTSIYFNQLAYIHQQNSSCSDSQVLGTWLRTLRDRSFNFLFYCTQCNQSWDYIRYWNGESMPLSFTYIHYVHHLNSHKTCTFPRTQSCDWSSLWDQTESLRRTYVYTTHCQLHPLHLATAQHCVLWYTVDFRLLVPSWKNKTQTDQSSTKCQWVFDWPVWFFVFLWWDKQPEINCIIKGQPGQKWSHATTVYSELH